MTSKILKDALTYEYALKKNYIVNGAMMISQENGTTAGTAAGYYPVDQFFSSFSNAGTQTYQQVASVTPGGSPNRLRVTATVADASVAAGDYNVILQRIEGLRAADLLIGSVSAKTITIQFGVKAPAGTYCVTLRNGASNRSYAAEYVIAAGEANTDVVKSVTVALDQTGTWAKDNTIGLDILWSLMCGSTFQTPAGAWTAGNFFASANQFNFMGTNGNVFELFDVSLTVGSTAPAFRVPDYPSELQLCLRYWEKVPITAVASTTTFDNGLGYKVHKRTTPTLTVSGSSNGATFGNFVQDPTWGLQQLTNPSAAVSCAVLANARL